MMTMTRNIACAALASIAMALCGVARAALVLPFTVEEMSAVSDDIVLATVEKSEPEVYNGKIVTRHELLVDDVAKGSAKKNSAMTIYTLGGRVGPVAALSSGLASLEQGEEVVLFLQNPDLSKAKAANVAVDEKSPLNTSPMIVGGFQGKFLVEKTVESHQAPGGKTVDVEKRRVMRGTPGRVPTKSGMPTVEEFMDGLKTLNSKSLPIRTTTKAVGSKQVAVPVADPNARALRAFDPPAEGGVPENLKLVGKVPAN